jgi:hypothetical protein
VCATGTAALLNVPQSLEQLLAALQVRDVLGNAGSVVQLRSQLRPGLLLQGIKALAGLGEALLTRLKGQTYILNRLLHVCCSQEAGYDLGSLPQGNEALAGLGEALLKTLKGQEEPRTVSKGAAGAL